LGPEVLKKAQRFPKDAVRLVRKMASYSAKRHTYAYSFIEAEYEYGYGYECECGGKAEQNLTRTRKEMRAAEGWS
jgi:hypothetical protein